MKRWLMILLVLAGAAFVVFRWQCVYALPEKYLAEAQLERHVQMLILQCAGNPWQYRILGEWYVEVVIRACAMFGGGHVVAFKIAYTMLMAAMLWVIAWYYRRVMRSTVYVVAALGLATYVMAFSMFDYSLPWSHLIDVILFVLVMEACRAQKFWMVIPLAVVGALNRETAIMLPMIPLLWPRAAKPVRGTLWNRFPARVYGAFALAGCVLVLWLLRVSFPPQKFLYWYSGVGPGFGMAWLNVTNVEAWECQIWMWLGTFAVVACGWRHVRGSVLWTVARVFVPVWMVGHVFGSILVEGGKVLVPLLVMMVPLAMRVLMGEANNGH